MHTLYEKVPPTRHELLLLKEQELNVRIGFELLKNKDDILVSEFFRSARDLHKERSVLNSCLRDAYISLVAAEEVHGVIATRRLASATKPMAKPTFSVRKVAGVSLPKIVFAPEKKNAFTRGYSPASASREVEAAASLFEDTLAKAVEVGEKESCVKTLGKEILKARRRSRALEQEILPEIHEEMREVRSALDMRSRETFVRTKRIKAML